MKLSEISEFELINRFKKIIKDTSLGDDILVTIGDDAAVCKLEKKNTYTLISTDSLLENVHFKFTYAQPYTVGCKAVYVNVSDIAAMGGIPKYLLISVSAKKDLSLSLLEDIYKGIVRASNKYRIKIIGGNTSSGCNDLAINITIIGSIEKKHIVTRSGAKTGDLIVVTGSIGEAYAGFKVLQGDIKPTNNLKKCIKKHLLPEPRVNEGRLIAVKGLATSMIDISDGLASDLGHLLTESKKGARIYANQIPISPQTKKIAKIFNDAPLDYALYGGEDYELLFTLPPQKLGKCLNYFKQNSFFPPTVIGEIEVDKERFVIINETGQEYPLTKKGFDHFQCSPLTKKLISYY
ncbi:MAG: thiamine-phosphate kinase [bacterium]